MTADVTLHDGVAGSDRAQAGAILWQAFEGKLSAVLGDGVRGPAVLARTLDPRGVVTARLDDRLVGVMALKRTVLRGGHEEEVSGVGGGLGDYVAVYGVGGLWRLATLAVFDSPRPDDTLMVDSLATAEGARGHGVGTALLERADAIARTMGVGQVGLDVVEDNVAAIRLYLRQGFTVERTERVPWPLSRIFGVSGALRMVRTISPGR